MLKLQSLLTEQQFKAKSKETGRVVVYKSKEAMDNAIKGGTAEPLDKKSSTEPGKVKGADLFKKDKPKSEPKLKNNLVKGLKGGLEPSKDSGLIKQTLDKLGDYPELKDKIDNLVDDIDNNSVGASEEEIERLEKKEAEVKNDIIKALSGKDVEVGTKVKDGKMISSGPQRFADDIKDMKGEYDLGGVTLKDGKMFDADGEEMDLDDIEDFYYQDAYDEKGNNVGIDIKKISEVYLKKSLDLLNEAQVWERKFGEPLPTLDSVMKKHQQNKGVQQEKTEYRGHLSRIAGINVFGDKKLELMSKNLSQTAFDLYKVAKKKDEQTFDDILQRITITIGVMRSFLNKPKRNM